MPAANGTRTATMNIHNNDYSEMDYNVALKGEGAVPEISVEGNNVVIVDGDATAGTANNTDFGTVNIGSNVSKTFNIKNTSAGNLTVSNINITGTNASEFTLTGAPAFPLTIAGNSSQTITIRFAPTAIGLRTATVNIANDDADEATYDFAIQGNGQTPTGIKDIASNASGITLYPNPTDNIATVSMKLSKDASVTIRLFDINGKEALEAVQAKLKAGSQQVSFNTSTLQSGTYFVQINTGGEPVKMKLIVAH